MKIPEYLWKDIQRKYMYKIDFVLCGADIEKGFGNSWYDLYLEGMINAPGLLFGSNLDFMNEVIAEEYKYQISLLQEAIDL